MPQCPLDAARAFRVESIKKEGGNVKYARFEGVGHNAWDYTFKQELIDWLLSCSK